MSRTLPSAILAVALLGAVPPPAARAQGCSTGTLALEARSSRALPVTYGIDGVTAGRDGEIALWASDGEILRLGPDGTERRSRLPLGVHAVGLDLDVRGIRILDGVTGREYLLEADTLPPPSDSVLLERGETLDRAVRVRGAWVLGLRHAPSHEFLVRYGAEVLFRSTPGPDPRNVPRYHLAPSGGGVLVTGLMAPFEVLRLAPGHPAMRLAVGLVAAADAGIRPDELPHWRALPAIELDCGLLLTLADLTSDARLLLRFAPDGALRKAITLKAPLGLMARLPGEHALLAARRTGGLELVWYTWHWNDEPLHPTN